MTATQIAAVDPAVDEFNRKTNSLTADLIEAALDDASILEGIPYGAVLVLLPDDDPEFVQKSIALGVEAVNQGKDVVFRHVARKSSGVDQQGPR